MACIHREWRTHQPMHMVTTPRALAIARTMRHHSCRILLSITAALHLAEHQRPGTRLCGTLRQSRHHRRHRHRWSVSIQELAPVLLCAISCIKTLYFSFYIYTYQSSHANSWEQRLENYRAAGTAAVGVFLWDLYGVVTEALLRPLGWIRGVRKRYHHVCHVHFSFALRRTERPLDLLDCIFRYWK